MARHRCGTALGNLALQWNIYLSFVFWVAGGVGGGIRVYIGLQGFGFSVSELAFRVL